MGYNIIKLVRPSLRLLLITCVLIALSTYVLVQRQVLQQQRSAKQQTRYLSQQLNTEVLHKNFSAATAISQQSLVKAFAKQPSKALKVAIDLSLDSTKAMLNAAIVYMLDDQGLVIASTSYAKDKTLLGKNYQFRPYFQQAIQGENIIYPALGVTTSKRGLYFSVPVYGDTNKAHPPIAVIVIKQSLDKIDQLLKKSPTPALLSVNHGIIFSSNQAALLYKSIAPLPPITLTQIHNSQQFADQHIQALAFALDSPVFQYQDHDYFAISNKLNIQNWQLHLLFTNAAYPYVKILIMVFFIIVINALTFAYLSSNFKRKEAIIMQRRSEQKFMELFYSSDDAMLLIDEDTFVDCNIAAAKMLGYQDKSSLLMQRPSQLSPPLQEDGRDSGEKANEIIKMVRKKGVSRFKWLHKKKNETLIPIEVSLAITPILIHGKTVIHCIWRDLTQIKQAETALIEAKLTAEAASQSKSDFLANMSHEIRTPMNGVFGITQLILDTELNEEQKNYILTLQQSTETLISIINDILDFSKIESGKFTLEYVAVDINQVLKNVTALLLPKAEEKSIQLKCTPLAQSIYVLSDPVRLQQVLTNLIGNAIKFTEQGAVELSVAMMNQQNDSITLNFMIKDSGIGIPEEKLADIFNQFAQADSSTTRKFGGTGLGLPISKQIIELMGGQIFVNSEEQVGSRFSFYLPLKLTEASKPSHVNAEKTAQPVSTTAHTDRFSGKVLLVEDNKVNLLVAKKLLENVGLSVTCAYNGQEAVELLQQRDFDIVFMDMQMPVMGGLEATRQIRAQQPEKKTPIIAMTANAMVEHRQQCISAGMNDFLSKPFDKKLLYHFLHKYHLS